MASLSSDATVRFGVFLINRRDFGLVAIAISRRTGMDTDELTGRFAAVSPSSYEPPVSSALIVGAVVKAVLAGVAVGAVCAAIAIPMHSELFSLAVFVRAALASSVLAFAVFLARARGI